MDDSQQMIHDTFSILVQWAMKYTRKHTVNNILRIGNLLG